MNPITVEINQEDFTDLLSKVRCASQTTGMLSEPGKILIKVVKGYFIVHVQSRQIVATAWKKVDNIDEKVVNSAVLDFARLYQIINTHDTDDEFEIILKDQSCVTISSGVGTWKLITDDRKSYEALNYKGTEIGRIDVKEFNKMVSSAGTLADTSKRSAIDSGVRMYHVNDTLNLFFATGTEAALLQNQLSTPFAGDFDVFIKSWVLKHLSLPGLGDAVVSINVEDEVLIFENEDTKIAISVSTDSSMNWADATMRKEHKEIGERTEVVRMNKLALRASINRLSKVSEGTIDVQILGPESANIHSQLRAGDRGDEKVTMFTNVKGNKKAKPTKATLRFNLAILKSITNIDTTDDELEFEYEVNTETGIPSIALFNGKLTKTDIDVQVVFPVGT